MEAQALGLCRAGKETEHVYSSTVLQQNLKNCCFVKLSKSKFLYLRLYFTSTDPQFGPSIVLFYTTFI